MGEQSTLPLASRLSDDVKPERLKLTLPDGYETSIYAHRPAGEVRRLPVLYVHGIQSHPGWFVGSSAALAKRGHAVFQVTRRGSGENSTCRGHARSADQLLGDIEASCEFVLSKTGSNRLHLVGVSWGGKLLAAFSAWGGRSIQPASLTIVTPGIVPQVDVSLPMKLAIALCLLVHPEKLFDIPLGDVELFTDNDEMHEYLRRDQFRLHRATARFFYASRCLDRLLGRSAEGVINILTTLILSRNDRIIDNEATRRVVMRLTGGRAVVREFDGAHTLEFEPNPQVFYDTVVEAVAQGETH